jgi:hypothetical protein
MQFSAVLAEKVLSFVTLLDEPILLLNDPAAAVWARWLSKIDSIDGRIALLFVISRKVRAHGLEEGVVFARLIGSLKTIRARTLRMEVVHPFANQQ